MVNIFSTAPEPFFVDEQGSVTVEYVVILTVVALGGVLAAVSIGPLLFRMFTAQVIWVLLPFS